MDYGKLWASLIICGFLSIAFTRGTLRLLARRIQQPVAKAPNPV